MATEEAPVPPRPVTAMNRPWPRGSGAAVGSSRVNDAAPPIMWLTSPRTSRSAWRSKLGASTARAPSDTQSRSARVVVDHDHTDAVAGGEVEEVAVEVAR